MPDGKGPGQRMFSSDVMMKPRLGHLYLLDILRGLASLAVVVWHYQHFFYVAPGVLPQGFSRSDQPAYALLGPFYEHGYLAVQLFFVLSGFIFYFNYVDKIASGQVSFSRFSVLRLSRLYPLHFVTLVFVAAMQMVAMSALGVFIVYPMNDLWHFFLNLFFASDWGLQRGHSFNAPIWSVSVEVILYAIFFVIAYGSGRRVFPAILLMFAGAWLAIDGMSHFGWGLFCFFAGGVSYFLYERLQTVPFWPVMTAVSFIFIGSSVTFYTTHDLWIAFGRLVLFGFCFPSLVLLLALIQNASHSAGTSLRVFGDITYSTYLLHFPIQLVVIFTILFFGWKLDFSNPVWMLSYLGAVIALSVPTYYCFEVPAMRFFRRRLLSKANAGGSVEQARAS